MSVDTAPNGPGRPSGKPFVPFILLVATVLVPTLFWYRNSFARPLNDDVLRAFLAPTATATETQHALDQLSKRIVADAKGESTNGAKAAEFYPLVVAAAKAEGLEGVEKRKAAAWLMQQDPHCAEFTSALELLLDDPEPLVVWNAAPAAALHGSQRARPALLRMLKPYEVTAPVAGVFRADARLDETLGAGSGSRIGKIETEQGVVEIPSPVMGRVLSLAAAGAKLAVSDKIATVAASQASAMNALAALTLPGIGRPEDAEAVEAFLRSTPNLETQVREQAERTLKSLRP